MVLALLLQIGLSGFSAQVIEASDTPPRIFHPPVLITTPSRAVPHLISWVPMNGSAPVIYVTTDFLTTAPPEVIRYVAFHEVCHLKLGHNLMQDIDPASMHLQVDSCLLQHLGVSASIYQSRYHSYVQGVLKPLRLRTLR